jgi:hypothetical protein
VRRLLVTANIVPNSPILVTLMMEALSSSETLVLTRATRRKIREDANLQLQLSLELKQLRKGHTENCFHNFCICSLCITEDISFNKPVTNEAPYSMSRERCLRNTVSEPCHIIFALQYSKSVSQYKMMSTLFVDYTS